MGKDEYYARVNHLTEAAMEKLSLLTPSVADFLLAHYAAIRGVGEDHLPEAERTSLVNLSFFYFLATCIDFLFFLHLRHRRVNIYEHELEHILGVLTTHARHQREEFRAAADPHTHATLLGVSETARLDWGEFERELRRYSQGLGGTGGPGSAA
ncbi:MAG TPA: hypothetical protein VIG69_12545 [Candidatus Methylomirabilis sp.]